MHWYCTRDWYRIALGGHPNGSLSPSQSERRDEKGSKDLDYDEKGRAMYKTGEWGGSYKNPSRWHDRGGQAEAGGAEGALRQFASNQLAYLYPHISIAVRIT